MEGEEHENELLSKEREALLAELEELQKLEEETMRRFDDRYVSPSLHVRKKGASTSSSDGSVGLRFPAPDDRTDYRTTSFGSPLFTTDTLTRTRSPGDDYALARARLRQRLQREVEQEGDWMALRDLEFVSDAGDDVSAREVSNEREIGKETENVMDEFEEYAVFDPESDPREDLETLEKEMSLLFVEIENLQKKEEYLRRQATVLSDNIDYDDVRDTIHEKMGMPDPLGVPIQDEDIRFRIDELTKTKARLERELRKFDAYEKKIWDIMYVYHRKFAGAFHSDLSSIAPSETGDAVVLPGDVLEEASSAHRGGGERERERERERDDGENDPMADDFEISDPGASEDYGTPRYDEVDPIMAEPQEKEKENGKEEKEGKHPSQPQVPRIQVERLEPKGKEAEDDARGVKEAKDDEEGDDYDDSVDEDVHVHEIEDAARLEKEEKDEDHHLELPEEESAERQQSPRVGRIEPRPIPAEDFEKMHEGVWMFIVEKKGKVSKRLFRLEQDSNSILTWRGAAKKKELGHADLSNVISIEYGVATKNFQAALQKKTKVLRIKGGTMDDYSPLAFSLVVPEGTIDIVPTTQDEFSWISDLIKNHVNYLKHQDEAGDE